MEPKNVEKLISLVRDRPLIYGLRPKRGKKKHQKLLDGLWIEIAAEMNRSVRECKLKWTTLRNCYARLLREERCNKEKKRHWHLRNQMCFLRGYIQPYNETRLRSLRRTVTACHKKTPAPKQNCSSDENSCIPSLSLADESPAKEVFQNSSTPGLELVNQEQLPTEPINNWEHLPEDNDPVNYCSVIKLSPFSLADRTNEPAEEICPSSPKHRDDQSESNSLFLRSLLTDLNKLSDRKQRIFKRKTLEVLEHLFDEGESDSPRDDHHMRQAQTTRSYHNNPQFYLNSVPDKNYPKVEPTSP